MRLDQPWEPRSSSNAGSTNHLDGLAADKDGLGVVCGSVVASPPKSVPSAVPVRTGPAGEQIGELLEIAPTEQVLIRDRVMFGDDDVVQRATSTCR